MCHAIFNYDDKIRCSYISNQYIKLAVSTKKLRQTPSCLLGFHQLLFIYLDSDDIYNSTIPESRINKIVKKGGTAHIELSARPEEYPP